MTPLATPPTVSVVVATRDRPWLLAAAVAAIERQDYTGLVECVVVYDQTKPDHVLARSSNHRSVVVVANGRTPGLAGARNSGALAASGELLAFCDDDDEWLPEKLRLQVARLLEADADVVTSGIYVIYENKTTRRVPTEEQLTVRHLARRRVMAAHPSTVVVRRAAFFGHIGLVDEEIPGSYGEDYDWMLRAASHGRIALVPQPLVRVLWGRQSFFAHKWRTVVDGIDYLAGKHPILRDDPRAYARLAGRQAFALAALGERRAALRLAWRIMRRDWRQPRSYLALLVGAGLVRAEWMLRLAHRSGRGI